MGTEKEVKFTVRNKDVFQKIMSLNEIAGYTTLDKGFVKIEDNYFDTENGALFKGKTVFRLRVQNGIKLLTFKAGKETTASYYVRTEIENKTAANVEDIISGKLPDEPPVKALLERMGNIKLFLSMKSKNNRRKIDLIRNGVSIYEIALDDCVFSGPRGEASVMELEIEALTEFHEDLEEVGKWIGKLLSLEPAGPSKYILGMTLVGSV